MLRDDCFAVNGLEAGPALSALGDDAYPRACGISRAMLRAEAAYRKALAQENLKALADEFMTSADKRFLAMGQDWFAKNTRMPKS